MAVQYNIAKRVRVTGQREDVSRLMAGMDVVAVPSQMEAFGMVSIEAMALSKPVVAARVGGIPEVVVDGKTGFLVEREPVALAQAILALLRNPERAAAMRKAGQARGNSHFTAARMTDRFACLYAKSP